MDPAGEHPSRDHADALLVAVGRGDLGAFAAFYDRTAPVVFGMLRDVLGHPGRVERAAEGVYLHLWRIAPGFDPTGRSAYATLLFVTRRALTGPVHALLHGPVSTGSAPDAAGHGTDLRGNVTAPSERR